MSLINLIINSVSAIQEKSSFTWVNIQTLWLQIREVGLGLTEVDNLLILIILIRLLSLVIKYNIFTAFLITLISIIAGYLWYSTFISTLFVYENALYKNSLTFKLGVDINQMKRIFQAKVISSTYQIRLTNPVGICLYALGTGSRYEDHRIDPLSMVVASLPESFPRYDWIEGSYYLLYRKIIPITTRVILDFIDAFTSYAIYTIITRVNKRYCPYLIRWHWTMIIILKFCEPYIMYLIYRIMDYSSNILYPQILKSQQYGIVWSQQAFEIRILDYLSFIIITVHLSFLLFAMFHATCGQYFYIPFFTKNVELHIGERDKTDIYSGGYTSWQDEKETLIKRRFPKIWYGWFGKGTKTDGNFFMTIFNSFKNLLRSIF